MNYHDILNPCYQCGEIGTGKFQYYGVGPILYYLQCNICGYQAGDSDDRQLVVEEWNSCDQPKIAVVIPEDIRMSAGKMASQAVHAALRTGIKLDYDTCTPTCVTLSIKNKSKMDKLISKCKEYNVPYGIQTDIGYTEVLEGTVTALAIGPAPETLIDIITKKLRLLKS